MAMAVAIVATLAISVLLRQTEARSTDINSNSILVAFLDSQHSEFSELVEKASLLQSFEVAVSRHNVTILAPRNTFLERNLDPDFRRFLLEPGNLRSLQALVSFHVIPRRVMAEDWHNYSALPSSLGAETTLELGFWRGRRRIGLANVVKANAIIRHDGVLHSVDRLLIPPEVEATYSSWKASTEGRSLVATMPESSPTLNSYLADRSAKSAAKLSAAKLSAPPSDMSYYAMSPGPSMSPAPAPGPSGAAHQWYNGEAFVADFIYTLTHYGGYNEIADLLVNLTSLAPELAKLVSEGYRITLLAPNDEAMAKLSAEDLAEPGAPEQIIYYHILPEYQTEESLYNSVRRFGKVSYETLLVPHKITAQEADGTVKFGDGDIEDAANLYDHDIYTDGRISVQGIDKVLTLLGRNPGKKNGRNLYEEDEMEMIDEEQREEEEEEAQPRRGIFATCLCKLGLFRDSC